MAVRKDRSVLIDRNLWQQLDEGNQVSLIFHEAIYAMTPVVLEHQRSFSVGNGYKQPSTLARQVVGYLFHRDLPSKGYGGLKAITQEGTIIPVDPYTLLEKKDLICAGRGVYLMTNKQVNQLVFTEDSEAEVQSKAKKYCSDLLAAFRSSSVQYGETSQAARGCSRAVEFDFYNYDQIEVVSIPSSKPGEPTVQQDVRSLRTSFRHLSVPYAIENNEQRHTWSHKISKKMVNVGTILNPKKEARFVDKGCEIQAMKMIKTLSER